MLLRPDARPSLLPPLLIWAAAFALVALLDARIDLAAQAMLMLLASALTGLWLPLGAALGLNGAAMLGFDAFFVPARAGLGSHLHEHVVLLGATLGVSGLSAALTGRLRAQVGAAEAHAREAEQLQRFGEALRASQAAAGRPDPGLLRDALRPLGAGADPLLLVLRDALPARDDASRAELLGAPDADARTGLWLCTRRALAFGPGTGRHEQLPAFYLPLRGLLGARGAALLPVDPQAGVEPLARLRAQAQALCDQMGQALERAEAERAAQAARAAAQAQQLRNTLLAAIAHDFRTPLATILGAASALEGETGRLDAAARRRLAASIVEETRALARVSDNTLQFARLDGQAAALKLDWESAEELVGAALHRRRFEERRVKTRVEPGLPLLRCDAALVHQLLDNLIDNALKYADDSAVEVLARRDGAQLLIAVRDRGPGVPPAERERVFAPYERGAAARARRGTGVGLALCRAIAAAHGGSLGYRARSHGGAAFELRLPVEAMEQTGMPE
ncbi:MAG: DUF4118 domain-containing protein [Pelomonas sp.]|nr:DUF4118 domain-containing protein [Roseateles sp.]